MLIFTTMSISEYLGVGLYMQMRMCAVIANNHIYIMRLLSTTRIVIAAINHYLHIR
jgi:hypothetical protein